MAGVLAAHHRRRDHLGAAGRPEGPDVHGPAHPGPRRHGVTAFSCTPAFLAKVLDDFAVRGPGALKHVASVGSALAMALVWRFHEACPHVALHNLYGASETAMTSWRTTCEPTTTSAPVGQPQIHASVVLLDGAGILVTEPGVQGQICFGGLKQKYLGATPADLAKFRVVEPFGELYFSGDVGCWGAHGLEVFGRMDRQVQINGIRVEPAEVEAAAMNAGLGVAEAVCVAPKDGELAVLVLFVTPSLVAAQPLRERIAQHKPSYMVPQVAVALERIPMLANGKFDLKELALMADEELSSSKVEIVDSLGIVRSVNKTHAQAQQVVECGYALGMIGTITAHWMQCGHVCTDIPAAAPAVQWILRNIFLADFTMLVFIIGGAVLESMQTTRVVLGHREVACFIIFLGMGLPLCSFTHFLMPWHTPCSVHRWYFAMYLMARAVLAGARRILAPAEQVALLGAVTAFVYSDLAPERPFFPGPLAYSVGLVEDCGKYISVWDRKFLTCVFLHVVAFHYGRSVAAWGHERVSPKACWVLAPAVYAVILRYNPYMDAVFQGAGGLPQACVEVLLGSVMTGLLLMCFVPWQPAFLRWLGRNALSGFVIHAQVPLRGMPWEPQRVVAWLTGLHHSELVTAPLQLMVVLMYPVMGIAVGAAVFQMAIGLWTLARGRCRWNLSDKALA
mmetsp:Transcript_79693/g.215494  ORF Transcript_79693/g.215494 Transcript_79693/m.215494 type:complete len:677 (+) Transcript_79693:1337-3367(+)